MNVEVDENEKVGENKCWVCRLELIDGKCPNLDCDSYEGQPSPREQEEVN